LRLQSKGAGFARIGVEQGYKDTHLGKEGSMPTESLFGVLAPLFHRDTIEQMRSRFVEIMTGPAGVYLFVNANFGNLVHEFYEPRIVYQGPQ
jgi:hypothetical protein